MPALNMVVDEFDRRTFVSGMARSVLGVGIIPVATAAAANNRQQDGQPVAPTSNGMMPKRVIYLYMGGGMSHVDTFDTKPGKDVQGPVESIRTNVPGIALSEFFPHTAMHVDKLAILNSLNSNQGAHAQGRYYMHTSYFLRGTISHPDLGAWSSYFLNKINPNLPANVKIGGNSSGLGGGFLESKHAALPIGDPDAGLQHSQLPKGIDAERFARRLRRARSMNTRFLERFDQKQVRAHQSMYDEAVRLMKSDDLQAFDLSRESQEVRESYGDDPFGQGCLLARRLVEQGVQFVEVDFGGWDTHTDNFERVAEKSLVLDRALSALLEDLHQRGLLEQTLVVLATEFGRTPKIVTEKNGRNHYPKAFSCVLAGGGVRGGIRYGRTDETASEVTDDLVTIPDFNATIAYALGLPLDKEVISPSRRPFRVADSGKPVKDLFA